MRLMQWCGIGVIAAAAAVGLYQWQLVAAPAAGKSDKKESAVVKVSVYDKNAKLVEVETPRVVKTDEEWLKQLGPETYKIVRAKGTERPFCGTLLDNKKEGVYACVGCFLPLFSSDAKFNSGTGWPSFFKPVAEGNVVTEVDRSYGMVREEILCGRCGGHLGHVFDDGPPPTGKRHCVNSESLKFYEKTDLTKLADAAAEKPATKPATKPAE